MHSIILFNSFIRFYFIFSFLSFRFCHIILFFSVFALLANLHVAFAVMGFGWPGVVVGGGGCVFASWG